MSTHVACPLAAIGGSIHPSSIQSKRRQDKFQDQVVYQENHCLKYIMYVVVPDSVSCRVGGGRSKNQSSIVIQQST